MHIEVIMVVDGKAHQIKCRPKQKRSGRRLFCPICGGWVESVYLPDGKEEFGCQECYRTATKKFILGPFPALSKKMKAAWGDKQY